MQYRNEDIPFISLTSKEEPFVDGFLICDQNADYSGSVRFAEVLDHLAAKRRERIVSIFGPTEFREISTMSSYGLMQFDGSFDILVCSVDDVARLRSAVRPPADRIIKAKTSFAYSEKTSPGRRAQLLKLGFDDVFYSSMNDDEIKLRFKMIIERNKVYSSKDNDEKMKAWDEFVRQCLCGQIRGRQKGIVEKLFHANGSTVSFRDLATYDFALNEYNTSSLKAIISNLRKKLKNCEIISVHGEGYRIVIHEDAEIFY